jgi:hypothetical protein
MHHRVPVEILHQIFIYLSVFDLEVLSKSNRYLYNVIKDRQFGKKYLQKQASELSAIIRLKTELSGLDRIAIAHTGPNTILVVVCSPLNQGYELFEVCITLTGRVYIHESKSRFECNYIENQQSSKGCSFCSFYGVKKYEEFVDKGYRIFFRTWKDDFDIRTESGIQLTIIIMHEEVPVGWDVPKPLPEFEIHRYGLFMPFFYTVFLENLWDVRLKNVNSSPIRTKTID